MREDWEKKRLNDFVWFQRGFDLPKAKFEKGNIPVYGSTSILGYHNVSKVKAPGVITGRSGTLGVVQYTQKDFWPHNTSLWVKDFKGNDERFAYYLLQSLDFASFNSGGAVPTLNRNVLSSFIVDVPPLKTQQKIASILSAYDDLIENNLKRIKLLEEQAQQTYEEWFVRFKFPGHEEVVFDEETGLPEGWEKKKVEEVCKVTGGGTPSKAKKEYWDKGTIAWYTPTDLSKSNSLVQLSSSLSINELGLKKSSAKLLQPNSFMMTSRATIGLFGITQKDFTTNQGFINITPLKETEKEFLLYLFKNNISLFENYATGTTFLEISRGNLKNIKLNWPSELLINQYHKSVYPMHKTIFNLTDQNQLLKEARDILLPRLMMGMIDPSASSGQRVEELEVNEKLGMVAEKGSNYNKE
ncbi:restriction endonuclease subunit S [Aequorivita marina]|uniref:restriction endonuclease subunit S n=1 Tax=Aequorivita marina TaxID=3073654 RepID=UPI0028758C05|nr:restriction endonuclease subunit S [Aequorivita sp. S2608]MDS1297321.1 restriction endonuclease subunit S [Aequorivita sp. S2608]